MLDLIIKNGDIVDGTGSKAFKGDLGILNGTIVKIGEISDEAKNIIDASGSHVIPGFVDIHTHYDGQVTWSEELTPSSNHGVTTAVMGNCGVGFAPCRPEDKERFQTIYAKHEGAVAAPTAGLHFSKHLMKRLEIKGIKFPEITLHVGLGSFNPVEVEDLSKHKMDSERVIIEQASSNMINEGLANKRKICAVGTTVMRAIESSVSSKGTLNEFNGWTNKFIFPPYEFNIANSMITNFHMPKSTLLMMSSAFLGNDFIKKAYEEAMKEKYKFLGYGDSMLII